MEYPYPQPPSAVTHEQIVNYYNAPVFKEIMAITCEWQLQNNCATYARLCYSLKSTIDKRLSLLSNCSLHS